MKAIEAITMSLREAERLKVIEAVAEGTLRASTAASKLRLSRRQIDRLTQRYRNEGPGGLVSRKQGRPGHHQ